MISLIPEIADAVTIDLLYILLFDKGYSLILLSIPYS
jgi:hypothetical protein